MLKVLAAVDGSTHANRAVEHLVRLARSGMPVEVLLLNVQPEVVRWQTHGLAEEAMAAHRQKDAEHAAQTARGLLRKAGIRHEFRIETGDAAETINRVAKEQGAELVVIGTRGMGAIENLVIGSVAYKVVHLAKAPVTLVK